VQQTSGTYGCLSLVIPAFREEKGIGQAIIEAEEALSLLNLTDYEILIIDDGSSDSTFEAASQIAKLYKNTKILRHDVNKGYGAALRTGFEAARFEFVAFTDADCQFYLEDLSNLLEAIKNADIATGYRFDRQDPKLRIFLSKGYNLLVHSLLKTGVRDCDCALKIFRKTALSKILPDSRNFFVNTEMFHKAANNNLRIAEVPVRHRVRYAGSSKVGWLEVPKTLKTLIPYCFSNHFFKPNESTPSINEWNRIDRLAYFSGCVLLLIFSVLLFGSSLRAPLLEPQEARYAEVPREMLLENEWVVPLLHGKPYLDKPPLAYWAVMGLYKIFGIHDWSARLLPCFSGIATIFVLVIWGKKAGVPWEGLIAGIILCLTNRFVYLERMLAPDTLLCFLITLGLALGYLACNRRIISLFYWLGFAICMGLGVLTKGPVALVLLASPIALWTFFDQRAFKPGIKLWSLAIGIAIAIAAPWQIAIAFKQPDFFHHFYIGQNFLRFVAPFDHEEPFWFFLPQLLYGMMPWIFLLPGIFTSLFQKKTGQQTLGSFGGFGLMTGLMILFFYSIGVCKRPIYLLPVLPPLAIALGCQVRVLLSSPEGILRWQTLLTPTSKGAFNFLGIILLAGFGVAFAGMFRGIFKPSTGFILGFVFLTALCIWIILKAGNPDRKISFAISGVLLFMTLYVGIREILPAYNHIFSLRGHLRAHLKSEQKKPSLVVCYPHLWDSAPFYLPDAKIVSFSRNERSMLIKFLNERPNTLVLIKSGRDRNELVQELPNHLEFYAGVQPGTVTVGWVRKKSEDTLLGNLIP
jgi:dolichol-phosphate mannosyltransferase